jgi:hypothetical protein
MHTCNPGYLRDWGRRVMNFKPARETYQDFVWKQKFEEKKSRGKNGVGGRSSVAEHLSSMCEVLQDSILPPVRGKKVFTKLSYMILMHVQET